MLIYATFTSFWNKDTVAFSPEANSSVNENCNQSLLTRRDTELITDPKHVSLGKDHDFLWVLMYAAESLKDKVNMFFIQSNEFFRPTTLMSVLQEEMSYGCCISFRLLAISLVKNSVWSPGHERCVSG